MTNAPVHAFPARLDGDCGAAARHGRPLRLLFVSNLYPPHYLGGYELLCAHVARALVERGHSVEVLTSTHGAAGADADGAIAVRRVLELQPPLGITWSGSRRERLAATRRNRAATSAVVASAQPDVIFLWSQLRLTVGPSRAAEASGIPTLYTFNDDNFADFAPRRWPAAARWLLDRTLHAGATLAGLRLETTTCISRSIRDRLVAGGVPVGRSEIVYQGVPIERFPCKPRPGALRRPVNVLYVGQVQDYKGVHTAVEALAPLAHEAPGGWRLTIVGDGPDAYRRRLAALSPSGAEVVVVGRVAAEDVPPIYREHDVFVFPSIVAEGFGLTLLEAMASGLPVISTTSGGQAECLEDGANALTFPAGDADALADRLRRLAADPALAVRLAVAGRRMVEERFTLARYVDELEALIRRCHRGAGT